MGTKYRICLISSFVCLATMVGCGVGAFLSQEEQSVKTILVLVTIVSGFSWIITGNIASVIYDAEQLVRDKLSKYLPMDD